MRLQELRPETVRRAIEIYLDLAYGASGKPRRGVEEILAAEGIDAVLAHFQKEKCEPVPGHPCLRYSLRLGNRNYPFMKLVLQEHLIAGEFCFSVDTHDQMDIEPDYPDYDAWMAVRRFNGELKSRIESQFEAEGIDTSARLRKLLAQRSAAEGAGKSASVLVVDDEEDLAEAVALLLEKRGFRAFKVHDGEQALRAVASLQPDLLLLDYELPGLDGIAVIERLRADPLTSYVPILLSSAAKVSIADIRKADGFLAKPYQEDLLFEMVNRLLPAAQRGAR
ncbi:MAG: hypothetical protein Fur0037_27770 [Planctomycetota bacterium]